MFEITKEFRFEAAHTLDRAIGTEASRRIHGHSFRATISVRGEADANGMVLDFGALARLIAPIRETLDHQLLDDVPNLGPATLENLAKFIWNALQAADTTPSRVTVFRDSEGDSASYEGQRALPPGLPPGT